MSEEKSKRRVVIKPSAYEFAAEVPWSDKKSILVRFRYHGGRSVRSWTSCPVGARIRVVILLTLKA